MLLHKISFMGIPKNYKQIDNILSRSAQPQKGDFMWLKKQGVTDIVDFKTTVEDKLLPFNEQEIAEKLGIKYHKIKTITPLPNENKVNEFLNLVKSVGENHGKVHIHCLKGSDRTGMYSFIYKSLNNEGDVDSNVKEWLEMGHNTKVFPNFIINWAKEFVQKMKDSQSEKKCIN